MEPVRHSDTPTVAWRDGVDTRMWSGKATGAVGLHMFEQFCVPGMGAPTHTHPEEEHLTMFSGKARVWVGEETHLVEDATTFVIPADVPHGFENIGDGDLHVIVAMIGAVFEGFYEKDPDGRWLAFESYETQHRRVDAGSDSQEK